MVCFVISAHGYGHASRQMEVIRVLLTRRPDERAVVFTAAPAAIFRDWLGPLLERIELVPYRADVGLVQIDGLVMDRAATLEALTRAPGVDELAARLASYRPSVIIGDIPPVAFAAAARLGVRSIAVGNFDWAEIYAHYPGFEQWAAQCRQWQALADLAIHLEPGPPLTGFARVIEAPPIARRAPPIRLSVPGRAILASFGGFGLRDAHERLPPTDGVTWILAPPMPDLGRPDTRYVTDVPYLSLLAGCDAVFTKPGYGMVCESACNRVRMLYTDRGDFPEYPWLVRWMHEHIPSVYVPAGASMRGAIDDLFALPERFPDNWNGAERVVDAI